MTKKPKPTAPSVALYAIPNAFASEELSPLSTARRDHQSQRIKVVTAEKWPDGMPAGLSVGERNQEIWRAFAKKGWDPPHRQTLWRMTW